MEATAPKLPALALRMEKSGRTESHELRGVTEKKKPTLARRDLGEVMPEENLAEPAHVALTSIGRRIHPVVKTSNPVVEGM